MNTNHFSEFGLKILFFFHIFLFSSFFHMLFIYEPSALFLIGEVVGCLSTQLVWILSFTACSSSWIKAVIFKVTVSSSDHLTSSETAEGASLFRHKDSGFLLSFFVVPFSISTTSFSPLDFCFSSIIHYPCA